MYIGSIDSLFAFGRIPTVGCVTMPTWVLVAIAAACATTAALLAVLRLRAAQVYDFLILHMTRRWYEAVFDVIEADISTHGPAAPVVGPAAQCSHPHHRSHAYRLLDVGIGTGTALATQAHRIVGKQLAVVGVDLSRPYCAAAQDHMKEAGIDQQVAVHCGSIYDVTVQELLPPQGDATCGGQRSSTKQPLFDAAYFSGSLTLMPDPVAALAAAASMVKPGGAVFITQTYQKRYTPLLGTLKPLLKYLTTIDFGPLTYESELDDIIAKSGCTVETNAPIAGSINTRFQVAKLVVLRKPAPGSAAASAASSLRHRPSSTAAGSSQ